MKKINKVFLHATNDTYNLTQILPPSLPIEYTEAWKNEHKDKVWVTTSILTAINVSAQIVLRYGGKPRIYIVRPDMESLQLIDGNEYICDSAEVLDIYL